jgi:hypothetical protein
MILVNPLSDTQNRREQRESHQREARDLYYLLFVARRRRRRRKHIIFPWFEPSSRQHWLFRFLHRIVETDETKGLTKRKKKKLVLSVLNCWTDTPPPSLPPSFSQ